VGFNEVVGGRGGLRQQGSRQESGARLAAPMVAGGLGARTRRVQGILNRRARCAGGLASRRSLPRHLRRGYGGEPWHARVTGGRRRAGG
jgi:hypothetical protein